MLAAGRRSKTFPYPSLPARLPPASPARISWSLPKRHIQHPDLPHTRDRRFLSRRDGMMDEVFDLAELSRPQQPAGMGRRQRKEGGCGTPKRSNGLMA